MIIGSYFFYWLIYCILYFFILIFSKLHAHFQSMEVRNSSFAAYFCIFLCIIYALFWYCFFHLIGLFYVTWLFIFYKFTLFWFILFLSDERAAYTWK